MLDAARARSDVSFRERALPDLDVEGSFDLVWAPYTVVNYLEPTEFGPAIEAMDRTPATGGVVVFDIGDFPYRAAPALQLVGEDDPIARLYWYRPPDNTHVRMDAVVFAGDGWFADRYTLTDYPTGMAAEYVRELGFSVDVHDWYDTQTSVADPAVIVASDPV